MTVLEERLIRLSKIFGELKLTPLLVRETTLS